MSRSERNQPLNTSSTNPPGTTIGRPLTRACSRASSADSIFEDLSIKANHLFTHLDVDQKGYLDTQILARAYGTRLDEGQLSELVHQLDQDGDGRVSLQDFKLCLRHIVRRNSMLRAKIHLSSIDVAGTRKGESPPTLSTSPDSTRSRLASDTSSETEDRLRSGSISGGTSQRRTSRQWTTKPRERTKDRLFHRRIPNCAAQLRQNSVSMPDLTVLDECFGALNCHEHIYELYNLLLAENPHLSRLYEFVLTDMIQLMNKFKQAQNRLEKQIECERSQHSAAILSLSEELDQQVQLAEDAARLRERQRILAGQQSLLETKSAEIEQLTERLQVYEDSITMAEDEPTSPITETRVAALQAELTQLRMEKIRLENKFTETCAKLVQTRTELTTLRRSFNEKSMDLDNHITSFMDVVKENSSLKRQLSLLQDVNRELCDANDGLCAVLERSSEDTMSKTAGLKEANTAHSLMRNSVRHLLTGTRTNNNNNNSNNNNNPDIAMETRERMTKFNRAFSVRSEESEAEPSPIDNLCPLPGRRTQRASAQRPQMLDMASLRSNTTCEDSGLSSLRDGPENESEIEVDSNYDGSHSMQKSGMGFFLSDCRNAANLRESLENLLVEDEPISNRDHAVEHKLECKNTSPQDLQVIQPRRHAHSHSGLIPPKSSSAIRLFRVMLAGDSAVGKTSLLFRLCDNTFKGNTVSTIGIDMKIHSITVDEKETMLQIWDTAGQERFQSISTSFYRKADGIMLVYDCTSETSFLNTRAWMSTIRENAGREIPVAIVATKVDLREEAESQLKTCVGYATGRKFAQEIGALFFETSALTGENVQECATELTRLLCAQEDYNLRRPQLKLNSPIPRGHKSCCNL